MDSILEKSYISGTVSAPPSKSYTHRAIISGVLVKKGLTVIKNFLKSDDTNATIEAGKAFGASITGKGELSIKNKEMVVPKEPVNCHESGSTIRFFIPIAALARGKTVLTGTGGLLKRPMEPITSALASLGIVCKTTEGFPPVTVYGSGSINGGKASIAGNISSQFISGLLFALPLAKRGSEVSVTTKVESKPYIEITLDILNKFGIKVDASEDLKYFYIPGEQQYKSRIYEVEGDFSSASFLLAAGAIAGSVTVKNLNFRSKQGDKEIVGILKDMDADIKITGSSIKINESELSGVDIDVGNMPDLVPILSVLGCFARGRTRIYNAARLRLKESDRLASITKELRKMNASIEERKDELIIHKSKMKGVRIDPHNDHRIAMSCAVAALGAEGETTITNSECIRKSYPTFFADIKSLEKNAE